MASDLRFWNKGAVGDALKHQTRVVNDAVRSLDPDLVLNTPVSSLAESLFEKYRVEPIVLDLSSRHSSGAQDIAIPFSSSAGRPISVDGTCVEVSIPFTGDEILLDLRASSYTSNPPRFDVRGRTVVVVCEGRAPLAADLVKATLDGVVRSIEQHLAWQRADIDPWNQALRDGLEAQIEARRAKVLADRELDAFLEVPVVNRSNASKSFAVDPPARPKPLGVKVGSQPGFVPEPAITDEGTSAILSEIESVSTAVQRLPKTFAAMPEESLRDVLLVVLNNRFGPASGETFSRRGKTDIFIPYEGDERAVFIAECKWWNGPAAFRKAIEQLRGYLTWRDSRAALVVFIRKGSPSEIAAKTDRILREHTSFRCATERVGRVFYSFANAYDEQRELHLCLILVPVLP